MFYNIWLCRYISFYAVARCEGVYIYNFAASFRFVSDIDYARARKPLELLSKDDEIIYYVTRPKSLKIIWRKDLIKINTPYISQRAYDKAKINKEIHGLGIRNFKHDEIIIEFKVSGEVKLIEQIYKSILMDRTFNIFPCRKVIYPGDFGVGCLEQHSFDVYGSKLIITTDYTSGIIKKREILVNHKGQEVKCIFAFEKERCSSVTFYPYYMKIFRRFFKDGKNYKHVPNLQFHDNGNLMVKKFTNKNGFYNPRSYRIFPAKTYYYKYNHSEGDDRYFDVEPNETDEQIFKKTKLKDLLTYIWGLAKRHSNCVKEYVYIEDNGRTQCI